MRVFGYNKDKRLVAVDMLAQEIADKQIDPWRVDVFDEDPISMRLPWTLTQKGHFRKLRELAFAYKFEGPLLYVGIHDGAKPVCLFGEFDNRIPCTAGTIVLPKFSISKRPFVEHYAEYLQQLEQKGQPPDQRVIISRGRQRGFLPKTAAGVRISGSTLIYDTLPNSPNSVCDRLYVGNMLTERAVSCPLPKQINWALDYFRHWQPVVRGEAIWKAFHNQPVKKVYVTIDKKISSASVANYLGETGMNSKIENLQVRSHSVEFEYAGSTFTVMGGLDRPGLSSDSCLYATRKDEVKGSRVAMLDLASGQKRELFKANAIKELEQVSQGSIEKKPAARVLYGHSHSISA